MSMQTTNRPIFVNPYCWIGDLVSSGIAKRQAASVDLKTIVDNGLLQEVSPLLGPRIPAETLRRFCTMLAHQQSGLLNAAEFAQCLGVDGKTIASYLGLLVDLLLVRRLEPWHASGRKTSSQVAAGLRAQHWHFTYAAWSENP